MYKLQLAISVTDFVLMNLLSVSLYVSLCISPLWVLSLSLSFTLLFHSPALLIFPLSLSPVPRPPDTYTERGGGGRTNKTCVWNFPETLWVPNRYRMPWQYLVWDAADISWRRHDSQGKVTEKQVSTTLCSGWLCTNMTVRAEGDGETRRWWARTQRGRTIS